MKTCKTCLIEKLDEAFYTSNNVKCRTCIYQRRMEILSGVIRICNTCELPLDSSLFYSTKRRCKSCEKKRRDILKGPGETPIDAHFLKGWRKRMDEVWLDAIDELKKYRKPR